MTKVLSNIDAIVYCATMQKDKTILVVCNLYTKRIIHHYIRDKLKAKGLIKSDIPFRTVCNNKTRIFYVSADHQSRGINCDFIFSLPEDQLKKDLAINIKTLAAHCCGGTIYEFTEPKNKPLNRQQQWNQYRQGHITKAIKDFNHDGYRAIYEIASYFNTRIVIVCREEDVHYMKKEILDTIPIGSVTHNYEQPISTLKFRNASEIKFLTERNSFCGINADVVLNIPHELLDERVIKELKDLHTYCSTGVKQVIVGTIGISDPNIIGLKAKEEPKTISEYNSVCINCGAPAYQGLMKTVCSKGCK